MKIKDSLQPKKENEKSLDFRNQISIQNNFIDDTFYLMARDQSNSIKLKKRPSSGSGIMRTESI